MAGPCDWLLLVLSNLMDIRISGAACVAARLQGRGRGHLFSPSTDTECPRIVAASWHQEIYPSPSFVSFKQSRHIHPYIFVSAHFICPCNSNLNRIPKTPLPTHTTFGSKIWDRQDFHEILGEENLKTIVTVILGIFRQVYFKVVKQLDKDVSFTTKTQQLFLHIRKVEARDLKIENSWNTQLNRYFCCSAV